MIAIPESHRTLPGLGLLETRALVFIVRDFRRREVKAHEERASLAMKERLSTIHVRKYLKLSHPETMKIINRLRDYGHVHLESRNSPGMTGNGYDGAIWGALTPKKIALGLVDQYFPN